MIRAAPEGIAVAGAGIAGLTAALAFAAHDFPVTVFERAPQLDETGAGLQLSPNATRVLQRLGVMEALMATAVRPDAITLRSARNLRAIARLPLGPAAEQRWGAPYLAMHRADLQKALLARVAEEPRIALETGTSVEGAHFEAGKITLSLSRSTRAEHGACALLVGADGVWSSLRRLLPGGSPSRFAGYVAWRAMADTDDIGAAGLQGRIGGSEIAALLHSRFHLVAYPVRGGKGINLVAVTKGRTLARDWTSKADPAPLAATLGHAHPALARLAKQAAWSAWPIFTADGGPWTDPRGMALIGDAAHAMTPFAAQGAAMAIEDAAVLAALVVRHRDDMAKALAAYDAVRRPRVQRVIARGAFNRFVWHAGGPVATGRDLVLGLRPQSSLMKDFDWLYGWDTEMPVETGGGTSR